MCAQPEPRVAGDAIPNGCRVIEVRVAELRQLFHSNDPSPFRERDLDPAAERFIVDWSRELPANAPLALVVHLERGAGRTDEVSILRDAIREFFGQRELATRRTLRELFRRGRISLAIGSRRLQRCDGMQTGAVSARVSKSWQRELVLEFVTIGPKTTTARGQRYLTKEDFDRQVSAGLLDVRGATRQGQPREDVRDARAARPA